MQNERTGLPRIVGMESAHPEVEYQHKNNNSGRRITDELEDCAELTRVEFQEIVGEPVMNLMTRLLLGDWLLANVGNPLWAQAGSASDALTSKNDPSAATTTAQGSANDSEYKIGPRNVLRIDIGKELQISRSAPMRPDCKISLPVLNDVWAAGLTPMQLAAVIADGLTKYITNRQATLSIAEINSRHISCNRRSYASRSLSSAA